MFLLRCIILAGLALSLDPSSQAANAPIDADSGITAAQSLMEQGDFNKALNQLRQLVQSQNPPTPETFVLMAACYQNLQQTAQALEACQQGMELIPYNAVLEDFYVTLLNKYVPVEEMLKRLEIAHGRFPQSALLLQTLVLVQMQLDPRSSQSEALIRKLKALRPNDPNSHYLYGMWAFRNQRDELAIAEWRKILKLSNLDGKKVVDVNTLIANAENRLGHSKLAESAFQIAYAANQKLATPDPAAAYFYLQFLTKNVRFEEGVKVIQQILSWSPHYGPAHLEQALHYSRQHQQEEALAEAHLALNGSDNSAEQVRAIHVLLAKICFSLKRQEEAESHQKWIETH
jgi:tetratricopeptide (TPR) repeat protein